MKNTKKEMVIGSPQNVVHTGGIRLTPTNSEEANIHNNLFRHFGIKAPEKSTKITNTPSTPAKQSLSLSGGLPSKAAINFGVNFSQAKRHLSATNIPLVVEDCIQVIEKYGKL
jgi:hypothetical protein